MDGGLITINAAHVTISYDSTQWYLTLNGLNLYNHDSNGDDAWAGADTNQLPQHFRDLGGTEIGAAGDNLNTIVPPDLSYNTVTPPSPTLNPTTTFQPNQIATVVSIDASNLQNIERGDILFLNNALLQGTPGTPPMDEAHTVLIAGWGRALTSWADYASEENSLSQFALFNKNLIYDTYYNATHANPPIQNPVPYIIDHGPVGDATANPTGASIFVYPRPYYMLWWLVPTEDRRGQDYLHYPTLGNIMFLHMPDNLVFTANPTPTPPYTSTYVLYPPPGLDATQLFNGHR